MHPARSVFAGAALLGVIAAVAVLEWYAHSAHTVSQSFRTPSSQNASSFPSAAPRLQAAAATASPLVAYKNAPPSVGALPLQPDAPPQILAMSLSTPVAAEGQIVSGSVETSSNVASVEARIDGYSASLPKTGEGHFSLSYRVPKLPVFFHRTYTIDVVARNARGDSVKASMPITIR